MGFGSQIQVFVVLYYTKYFAPGMKNNQSGIFASQIG